MVSDERKKLTLWGRQSTYVGGPSVVNSRKYSTTNSNRARSADARCFGFGSGTSRFTIIQSSPASPMADNSSMFWYYKDIDIDGGKSGDSRKIIPKRSRHDCHFPPGSTTVPLGKNKSLLASYKFPLYLHIPTFILSSREWSYLTHLKFSLFESALISFVQFIFVYLFECYFFYFDYKYPVRGFPIIS